MLRSQLTALGAFVGLPPWDQRADMVPVGDAIRSASWIAELVQNTRTALAANRSVPGGPVEDRVVASTAHLSALARVVSPVVAIAALADHGFDIGRRIRLGFDDVRLAAVIDYPGVDEDLRQQRRPVLADALLRDLLIPFGASVHNLTRLSPAIIAGNTASSLRGAVTVLSSAQPDVGRRAAEIVGELLHQPELISAWTSAAGTPPLWRRRSCCLFYRVSGFGLCGDCSLDRQPEPVRRPG